MTTRSNEIVPTKVTRYPESTDGNVAGNSVDKDMLTVSVSESGDGEGWLKLEFDKAYLLDQVIVYSNFYSNWYGSVNDTCQNTVAGYQSCKELTTGVTIHILDGDGEQIGYCGTLEMAQGLQREDQIYRFVCNAEGAGIRLYFEGSGRLAINEIVVTARTGEPTIFRINDCQT